LGSNNYANYIIFKFFATLCIDMEDAESYLRKIVHLCSYEKDGDILYADNPEKLTISDIWNSIKVDYKC